MPTLTLDVWTARKLRWPWRNRWRPGPGKTPRTLGRFDPVYAPLPCRRQPSVHFSKKRHCGALARFTRAIHAVLRGRRSWAPGTRIRGKSKVLALSVATSKRKKRRKFSTLDRASLKVQNLRHGRLHVLRWLLWEAEMPALERSTNGALALHYAAARGCLDCVKLLVEASPDHSANAQMENAVTPVYLAAQEGHLDVLRYLVLDAGGSLLLRAKDGMAPLHAAAQMGCLPCIKWMVQEQGVDPDLRDGDGATALHFAASRGHADSVRWLLRHGARLVLDKFGKSPLNDAAENEQIECLSILVQHGTLPDYSDDATDNNDNYTQRPREHIKGVDTNSLDSEPFYLHPPSLPSHAPSIDSATPPCGSSLPGSLGGPEIYINPMADSGGSPGVFSSGPDSSSGSECSFYLHNPRDVIYNRVKDLFEVTPSVRPPSVASSRSLPDGNTKVHISPTGAVTVRVDVHTSDVSSSELSEPSAGENDYEDIYQVRHEAGTEVIAITSRPTSRASGSSLINIVQAETRRGSVTSVVLGDPPEPPRRNSPIIDLLSVDNSESESRDKVMVSPRHSLPPLQNSTDRALKRVVSEPGGLQCPPPPPPPPPAPMQSDMPQHFKTIAGSKSSEGGKGGHMVLPFVPPKFPTTDSDSLIKPSEYLRSLSGGGNVQVKSTITVTSASVSVVPACPPVQEETSTPAGPPPPPLPQVVTPEKPKQALSAISIHDLSSVQLRRTDRLGKVLSAPLGPVPASTASAMPPANPPAEPVYRSQKDDLIAELKRSRDISGIRKIRVERAKSEEREDKERFTKLSKQYSVDSFVEQQVPECDSTGNPIPVWKRQMLAKKVAERARREAEERAHREAEEQRMKNIPAWKRQLMAQRKDGDSKRNGIYPTRLLSETESSDCGHQQAPAATDTPSPALTIIPSPPPPENNKENSQPSSQEKQVDHTPVTPIMPWRAQLRKTNSTLNLLE